jgi:predicted DNA-binding ribbon-helix-helix protein
MSQRSKRSMVIAGHRTTLSMPDVFWFALKEIAAQEGIPVSQLVNRIDIDREYANLSSLLRVYVVDYYRRLAEKRAEGKNR